MAVPPARREARYCLFEITVPVWTQAHRSDPGVRRDQGHVERKSWTVDVDGAEHVVALDWTYWGGRRLVSLDGAVVNESTVPMRGRSEQSFDLKGHPAVLRTRPSTRISAYFLIELEVDGNPVTPDAGRKAYWEA